MKLALTVLGIAVLALIHATFVFAQEPSNHPTSSFNALVRIDDATPKQIKERLIDAGIPETVISSLENSLQPNPLNQDFSSRGMQQISTNLLCVNYADAFFSAQSGAVSSVFYASTGTFGRSDYCPVQSDPFARCDYWHVAGNPYVVILSHSAVGLNIRYEMSGATCYP